MDNYTSVIEYKCPCCNAGLSFDGECQQMKCEYCDNVFDFETVRTYNESESTVPEDSFSWEETQSDTWQNSEAEGIHAFQCTSCGGEIITDENTAATFCPFCDNPTILPSRLSGTIKPSAVIPFQKTKEDAKTAFLNLCKSKPLLPKDFTSEQRLEHITGVYVPFWLYDCVADYNGSYKATRIHRWSDSRYYYTRTDHFLLRRGAKAAFCSIPMDASSKMDDTFMESIEPYDYSQLEEFDLKFLSGYYADKYDIPSDQGKDRIKERVDASICQELQGSLLGYATVIPSSRQLHVKHGTARYVLLPVWLLSTNYQGSLYTFAMNGQTGKMTGSFPICSKRSAFWFAGVCAAVTVIATLAQLLL